MNAAAPPTEEEGEKWNSTKRTRRPRKKCEGGQHHHTKESEEKSNTTQKKETHSTGKPAAHGWGPRDSDLSGKCVARASTLPSRMCFVTFVKSFFPFFIVFDVCSSVSAQRTCSRRTLGLEGQRWRRCKSACLPILFRVLLRGYTASSWC